MLGGPVAVSRVLDVRPQAISQWIRCGRVPVDRVPALLRRARELNVSLKAADLRGDVDWEAVCCERA